MLHFWEMLHQRLLENQHFRETFPRVLMVPPATTSTSLHDTIVTRGVSMGNHWELKGTKEVNTPGSVGFLVDLGRQFLSNKEALSNSSMKYRCSSLTTTCGKTLRWNSVQSSGWTWAGRLVSHFAVLPYFTYSRGEVCWCCYRFPSGWCNRGNDTKTARSVCLDVLPTGYN